MRCKNKDSSKCCRYFSWTLPSEKAGTKKWFSFHSNIFLSYSTFLQQVGKIKSFVSTLIIFDWFFLKTQLEYFYRKALNSLSKYCCNNKVLLKVWYIVPMSLWIRIKVNYYGMSTKYHIFSCGALQCNV